MPKGYRSQIEMKNCPFCGSDDVDESFGLRGDGKMSSGCMNCGASSGCADDVIESVKIWNTRAEVNDDESK